jgi:hypothetical protein
MTSRLSRQSMVVFARHVAAKTATDTWTCANQTAPAIAHSAAAPEGAVLDDGKFYGFGTVSITSPGLYLVIGKGTVGSDENVQDFRPRAGTRGYVPRQNDAGIQRPGRLRSVHFMSAAPR